MVKLLSVRIKIDFLIMYKMTTILDTDTLGVIVSFLDITKDKDIYQHLSKIHKLTDNESSKILDYWLANSKVECEIDEYNTKRWYTNGKQHRENGLPAVERTNGSKYWYVNGKYHRDDDKPAIECVDGTKYWFVNGQRHRDSDRPAIEYADGSKYWYVNGQLHRDNDKPAIECADSTKSWFVNGKLIKSLD